MSRKRPQVLGIDLNRSESRIAETMLLSRYVQGDWDGGMFPLAPRPLAKIRPGSQWFTSLQLASN